MKQSKRRIGVKRELLHPKQEREQNIQYHPHLCLICYDNRRYSVMTTNGESGRGNNRKLTNDRMTGEIM